MLSNQSKQIRKLLLENLPKQWDGKASILEMKNSGSSQWRQMEWPGFFFEFKSLQILKDTLGESPSFQINSKKNVDYSFQKQNWDFKHHSLGKSKKPMVPSNDAELVERCIQENGHWGLVIGIGESVKGEKSRTCEFHMWHTKLKGGPSRYSMKKIKEGATPRARKIKSTLVDIFLVEFTSIDQLNEAVSEGWACPNFQKNMKNSNDKPRNSKYQFRLDKICDLNIDFY